MKLIFTIAWRNILRHRGKSLVIGAILFIGAFLMTLGNGVTTGMDHGIKKNIVNSFMGDIVLISEKQKSDNILFDMMGSAIEPVTSYRIIKETLKEQDFVDRFVPVGKNLVMLLKEDENQPGFTYLLGVDFNEYQKMFPQRFEIIEGTSLVKGQNDILIPTHARDDIYMTISTWLIPEGGELVKKNLSKDALDNINSIEVSSTIVLMGTANSVNSSTDIRFGVKGIYKYAALNHFFGNFCITDIELYRECMGYFSTKENMVEVPKEEKKLLSLENEDLDSLFGAEDIADKPGKASSREDDETAAVSKQQAISSEFGTYNLVFIKLKSGVPYDTAIKKLNAALQAKGAGVRAVTWNRASGPVGSMAIIIKSALFVFVTLLFVVAIIIIINTLTMSALERTSEIGMMRAIGAKKSFIAGMFYGETGILSAFFGGAGIVFGVIAVKIIPLFNISTTNDMLQMLYGGDVFHPLLFAPDILITVFQLVFVTVIAALYPVSVARGITPLDAIS